MSRMSFSLIRDVAPFHFSRISSLISFNYIDNKI